MPYIPQADRKVFDRTLTVLIGAVAERGLSNGELNYLFTKIANIYIDRHGLSYNTGSDVIKAFECAKLELYARVMRPYEDRKIAENGDVFNG